MQKCKNAKICTESNLYKQKRKIYVQNLRTMKLLSEPMSRKNYFPQQESAYQNLPGATGRRIP